MMLRQSHINTIGLAGIMLFVAGFALDFFTGREGIVHVKLGMTDDRIRFLHPQKEDTPATVALGVTVKLDSLHLFPFPPEYELQVREIDQEGKKQFHPGSLSTTKLKDVFPLKPMKIQKLGETEYRFRLIEFYPDFTFTYTYPENSDTIAPRAPGITLNLTTPLGEQIVTLGSTPPNKDQLDDVVQFGFTIHFVWEALTEDHCQTQTDSGATKHKIVFAGKNRKVYFCANDVIDSLPLELNRFYPIPGKDTLGFTVLQSFPDAALLKAVPATKSDSLQNPVARVEVWKKGGLSEEVYVYPVNYNKRGGQWNVPGSNLLLTLGASHILLADACKCNISFVDSLQSLKIEKALQGNQHFSFEGNKWELEECDPNGLWVNLRAQRAPGRLPKKIGFILMAIAFLGYIAVRSSGLNSGKKDSIRKNEEDHPAL